MKLAITIVVCIFFSTATFAQAGSARVAYIDMEYILKRTPEYIEATRAVLKYELPLNEIIYDFFDVDFFL